MLMYIQLSPSAIPVAIEVPFDGYADHMLTTVVVMMLICVAGAFNPGTLMCCAYNLLPRFITLGGTIIITVTTMSPYHIAVANPCGIHAGCYIVNSDPALTNSPLGPILVPKQHPSA